MRKIHDYETKLDFGKYKGETVRFVMKANPSYIVWASENVGWFKVKKDVLEKAIELAFEREMYRHLKKERYNDGWGLLGTYHYYDDDVYEPHY